MADRYQNRPFPADDHGRAGDQYESARQESDPLAELARLIGQTDPFSNPSRANVRVPPQNAPEPYQPPVESYEEPVAPPPSPPAWMRRANAQVQPSSSQPVEPPHIASDSAHPVHPLHRYPPAPPEHDDQQFASYEGREYAELQPDPSRYDDALYGRLETGEQQYQREEPYQDDQYAYQRDYPEDADEEAPKRRGGIVMVAAILALAIIGTGGAFAYRTYMGSPRSAEPPIIKADNTPTKIMPAPSDGSGKRLDRMASADGTEKIVPREEAPVDINARSAGPRVVFPPLNQNANPPPVASVAPINMPPSIGPAPSNGTMPNSEPRRIKTLSVRGDQVDGGAPTAPAPTAKSSTAPKTTAAPRNAPSQANASAPMSLAPQAEPAAAPTRTAAANPVELSPNPASEGSGGSHLVSVTSQPTEASARESYRVLQGKFPSVLGPRSPVVKRVELSDRVVYRAMVGPYRTRQEATQFCTELKAAGGQCFVP